MRASSPDRQRDLHQSQPECHAPVRVVVVEKKGGLYQIDAAKMIAVVEITLGHRANSCAWPCSASAGTKNQAARPARGSDPRRRAIGARRAERKGTGGRGLLFPESPCRCFWWSVVCHLSPPLPKRNDVE